MTSEPSTSSSSVGSSSASSESDKDSPPPEKKQKLPPPLSSSSSSSSESRKGKSKLSQNSHSKSSAAGVSSSQGVASDGRTVAQVMRKMSAASDVPANEKEKVTELAQNRKAYKSLFNSHAGERPKDRTSHWVTFFPYH